jgi:hypothetical protein
VPLSDKGGPALPDVLMSEINRFQLEGYAKEYFRTAKKGMFKRTVPVQELLVWTKEPLHHGLLRLHKDVDKHAVTTFKLLLEYMGDAGGRAGRDETALGILEKGIKIPEMRDEIFIQICKQTTSNPNPASNTLGWEMMAMASALFLPTKNLEPHLGMYLSFYVNWPDDKVRTAARFSLRKLRQQQRKPPPVLALPDIDKLRKAPTRVSLFGTTLAELMEQQQQQQSSGGDSPMPSLPIPHILARLTQALKDVNGFQTEGIFRISAESVEVDRFKLQVDSGQVDLSRHTPHEIACLLKLWLRELEEPVIPIEAYQTCIQNCTNPNAVAGIVGSLPELNRQTLLHVVKFLQELASPSNVGRTKMTAGNLALIFSPLLLRCPFDDPMLMLQNTKFETEFVLLLLQANWEGDN